MTEPSGHSTVLSSQLQGRGEPGKTREFHGPSPHFMGCWSLLDSLCMQSCRITCKPGPSVLSCTFHGSQGTSQEAPGVGGLPPVDAVGGPLFPVFSSIWSCVPCIPRLAAPSSAFKAGIFSLTLLPSAPVTWLPLCWLTCPSTSLTKTLRIVFRAYLDNPGLSPCLKILNSLPSALCCLPCKGTFTDSRE